MATITLKQLHDTITNFVDENQGASYGMLAAKFASWDQLVGIAGYSEKAFTEMLRAGELIQVSDNPNLGTYKYMLPW